MTTTRRSPRGQNLLLMALSMLFLALLVTMTLGLGLRLRQKHELQNLADAAAYSNAVVEARAFNNLAIVNRLQVSYWVAMAANESLISWTGYARGMATGARRAARSAVTGCRDARARAALDATQRALSGYAPASGSDWDLLDARAGVETRKIRTTIDTISLELTPGSTLPSPTSVVSRLERLQLNQQLTQQVLRAAGQDDVDVLQVEADPLKANNPVGLTRREVDCDFGGGRDGPLLNVPPTGPGLCLRPSWNWHILSAAMGTRGDRFLTGRGLLPPKPQREIELLGAARGARIVFGRVTGSGYWSVGRETHGTQPATVEAWADDHGAVTVTAGGCSGRASMKAHVRSTHLDDNQDSHGWDNGEDGSNSPARHTMGTCSPMCPSVWVRTSGFLPADSEADNYGQPHVVVALERDLAKRPFPWELHFTFPFSATGAGREWDGRGRELRSGPSPGLDISRQVAWATGLVYYHRAQHWDEFPNLLNPFWRATLAPTDVDDQGSRDVVRTLRGPYRFQGDAYDALVRAGFKGLH